MPATKRTIEIFIGPTACTCAGGPTPAKQEKITRAFSLKSSLEQDPRFEVRTWRLGDDDDYQDGMRVLRGYLAAAGEEELAANLAFTLNNATPSVAVDGKLDWLAEVPTVEELLSVAGDGQ